MGAVESTFSERREWFGQYFSSTNAMVRRGGPEHPRLTCPVCGYPTLSARADFQICNLCDWEDDGVDDPDTDEPISGPNGDYPLSEARRNFEAGRTMYRPGSTGYERTRRDLPIREALVVAFEAIKALDYRDHWRISQFWAIVDDLEGMHYS